MVESCWESVHTVTHGAVYSPCWKSAAAENLLSCYYGKLTRLLCDMTLLPVVNAAVLVIVFGQTCLCPPFQCSNFRTPWPINFIFEVQVHIQRIYMCAPFSMIILLVCLTADLSVIAQCWKTELVSSVGPAEISRSSLQVIWSNIK